MTSPQSSVPVDVRFKDVSTTPRIGAHILSDDGMYPNNELLPLLVYQGVLGLSQRHPAAIFEDIFEANQWSGSWRNGVYGYHHYHSTAHEVLGVCGGTATVQLGGEHGITLALQRGDVIIIPAGVVHKNLGASPDFLVVGAYPLGQYPNMRYGKPGERPQADQDIARVTLPEADPVYGRHGHLRAYWDKHGGGQK